MLPFYTPWKHLKTRGFLMCLFFFFGGGGGGEKGKIGPKRVDDKSLDSLHMFFKTKLQ